MIGRMERRTLSIALGLVAAGCAHTMKVPDKVDRGHTLTVERYGGLKEKELKVGGAVVRDIDRSWTRPTGRGLVGFEKAPDETSLTFAFQREGLTLAGSCLEELSTNMMGLKDPKVSLTCTCKVGETVRARLTLEQYQGAAELVGAAQADAEQPAESVGAVNRFNVYGVHTDSRGKKRKEVLGYWFQGRHGEGAIDLEGKGKAWLPGAVSNEEKSLLLCLYSGLLLYRPGGAL
jgi:hypothetical protein